MSIEEDPMVAGERAPAVERGEAGLGVSEREGQHGGAAEGPSEVETAAAETAAERGEEGKEEKLDALREDITKEDGTDGKAPEGQAGAQGEPEAKTVEGAPRAAADDKKKEGTEGGGGAKGIGGGRIGRLFAWGWGKIKAIFALGLIGAYAGTGAALQKAFKVKGKGGSGGGGGGAHGGSSGKSSGSGHGGSSAGHTPSGGGKKGGGHGGHGGH